MLLCYSQSHSSFSNDVPNYFWPVFLKFWILKRRCRTLYGVAGSYVDMFLCPGHNSLVSSVYCALISQSVPIDNCPDRGPVELYQDQGGRWLNNPFLQVKVQEMICFLGFSVFTGQGGHKKSIDWNSQQYQIIIFVCLGKMSLHIIIITKWRLM